MFANIATVAGELMGGICAALFFCLRDGLAGFVGMWFGLGYIFLFHFTIV